MADGYPVGELAIWGAKYPVTFRHGQFRTDVGPATVSAVTWDELDPKVKSAVRKQRQRVEIPFVDQSSGQRGVAVGMHSTRRAAKIEWESGTVDYGDPHVLHPETDRDRLRQLITARRAAEVALRDFLTNSAHPGGTSLTRVVEKAQADLASAEAKKENE